MIKSSFNDSFFNTEAWINLSLFPIIFAESSAVQSFDEFAINLTNNIDNNNYNN